MTCQVSLGVKLFFNFHLIQQISRSGIFVHDEENVADVDNDTALVIGEILDVAADSFPIAVEIYTDQFTDCIHHTLEQVVTHCKFYHLQCRPDQEAAVLSAQTLQTR